MLKALSFGRRDPVARGRSTARFRAALLPGLCLFVGVGLAAQSTKLPPEATDLPDFTDAPASITAEYDVQLDLARGGRSQRFQLIVPEDAFSVRIALEDSPADLDLRLLDAAGGELLVAELLDFNEQMQLSRLDGSLPTGRLTVEVFYQLSGLPMVDGRPAQSVTARLTTRIDRMLSQGQLREGQWAAGELSPESGMFALFTFELPPRGSWRLDLESSQADVDLFVNRTALPDDFRDSEWSAYSLRSRETILLGPDSNPSAAAGSYQVLVVDQVNSFYPADYRIRLARADEPDGAWRNPPEIPRGERGIDRALRATVELATDGVSGGSGTIVSSDGLVLTNHHVVSDGTETGTGAVTVAVSYDHRLPPLEVFRADIVWSDPVADLAILQMTETIGGGPLPRRFPFTPIGDPDELRIGEPLSIIGYPSIGGRGSRVSITLAEGRVSGFDLAGGIPAIKTDGDIHSGNSGGGALDRTWRLVGVPTEVVGGSDGQIGYAVSVEAIPPEWIARFGLRD